MTTSRRSFLKATAGVASASVMGFSFAKRKPELSLSTLGCPTWPLDKIIESAVANTYSAIEFRGIEKEMFLPKRPEFSTPEGIALTRRKFADNNLKICNLGSSANLHFADPVKRKKNLDEGREFIDLAHELKCPYVRVFPNNFPKDQEKGQTMDLIISGLLELADYAKKARVTVLLESHGDLVWKDDLLQIMKKSEHPNVALIWDIFNMWSVTKEPPAEVYAVLRKYIKHAHIKDGSLENGKLALTLIGRGKAPLKEAIGALKSGGYKGYYSLEWEKMWHPEIEEPDVAFDDYPQSFQKIYDQA